MLISVLSSFISPSSFNGHILLPSDNSSGKMYVFCLSVLMRILYRLKWTSLHKPFSTNFWSLLLLLYDVLHLLPACCLGSRTFGWLVWCMLIDVDDAADCHLQAESSWLHSSTNSEPSAVYRLAQGIFCWLIFHLLEPGSVLSVCPRCDGCFTRVAVSYSVFFSRSIDQSRGDVCL